MSAIAAGLVAGITVTFFACLAEWRAGLPPSDAFTYFATIVAGDQAVGASWAVPLGVVAVLAAAVAWAFGYLYAAERQPQLVRRPLLSGIGFGVIVWLMMLALTVLVGKFHPPTIYSFDRDIVGFTVFFGIPLAFVVARLTRAGA